MKKNGFTLIEILVSVGILAIVSTLMAQVLFTTTHVNTRTNSLEDIKQNGNFTLDVIGRMVRGAQTIETSCSSGPTAISANITNPDNNVTTLLCVSDGKAARIASVSGTNVAYLSAGNVTLSASGGVSCADSTLTFSCPPATGIQNQLTIGFTLGQLGVSGSAFNSGKSAFQSTVDMRN